MIGAHTPLAGEVARLKGWLRAAAAPTAASVPAPQTRRPRDASPTPAPDNPTASAAVETPEPATASCPHLDRLAAAFGLGRFERALLLLTAAAELDPEIPRACVALGAPAPCFAVGLAALPEPRWSAVTPAAPLRAHRLLEVGAGPLAAAPLTVDERILHELLGLSQLDRRLVPWLVPVVPAGRLPTSHGNAASRASTLAGGHGRVRLAGRDRADRRAVAACAAEQRGWALHRVHATDLPATSEERDAFLCLWDREVRLAGGALLVELGADDPPEAVRAAAWVADRAAGPVLTSAAEATSLAGAGPVVAVATPTRDEQRALWARIHAARTIDPTHNNGDARDGVGDPCDAVARAFDLPASAIAATGGDGPTLWAAARAAARPAVDGLAQRVAPTASWSDLVLADDQAALLHEIARHVRHRVVVHDEWALASRSGRGVTALFAGPSGTGKTLAAEVLAHDLGLDLYRIDLSAVVSKYIGETEKNLRRVFDAAEGGGAVLLFDEADALFGKRTEVRDSHDRYANIEVSYLLQRMEAYTGLAILTTNLRSAIDEAFLRRIRFAVPFPFPDQAERAAIWRHVFPPTAPADGLDPDRLARLTLAGGSIHNVAVAAAVRAADAGTPIGMAHVRAAVEAEYAKLERALSRTETAAFAQAAP